MTLKLRVDIQAGAFIDGYYYPKGEIVEIDLPKGARKPMWGTEVGEDDKPVGNKPEAELDVEEALIDALADKIAVGAGQAGLSKEQKSKAEAIATILGMLETDKDEHWTEAGLPSVAVVEEMLGGKVTRAEIEAAKPGFRRN